MPPDAQAQIGILIEAQDKASKAVSQVAASVQKSTGALVNFGNAAGAIRGPIGGVIQQVAGLGSMMATTGPFGLAIAGVTLAVGAATKVWSVYKEEQESIQAAARSTEAVFLAMEDRLKAQRDAVSSLVDEFRFFGVEARQQQIETLERDIAMNELGLAQNERWAEQLKERIELNKRNLETQFHQGERRALTELIGEQEKELANLTRAGEKATEALWNRKEQLAVAKDLQVAAEQEREDKAKQVKVERDLTAAAKERAEAQRANLEYTQIENQRYQHLRDTRRRMRELERNYEEGVTRLKQDWELQRKSIRGMAADDKKKALEAEKARELEFNKEAIGSLMALGSAYGQIFASIGTEALTAEQVARRMFVATARSGIQAAIQLGMAKAVAAYSGLPFVGMALGLGAAAGISELLLGYLSDVPKAQFGGLLASGPSTGDRTIVRMNAGELTMPPDVTAAFRRIMSQDRGDLGGVKVTFAPRLDMFDRGTRGERKRVLMELRRDVEELVDNGLWLRKLKRSG